MTATINYDRPVKNLIDELSATNHVTHKAYKKKSVTFHHNAGRLSHDGVLRVWQVRPASAHFNSDAKGTICQYVKVNEYAWACGNSEGNRESIHIEMCNETLGPEWKVSDVTWKSAARLGGWLFAKVIGTRPTADNVHFHNDWKATACAGPYMDKLEKQLLDEVIKAYEYFKGQSTPPRPGSPSRGPRKSNTQIAAEVWAGKWGSGDNRKKRLKAAGYNPEVIQDLVNKGVGRGRAASSASKSKSIEDIAREVIAGKWGNGPTRRTRLLKSGYSPTKVQNKVNDLLR